jgi:hypothetical protein
MNDKVKIEDIDKWVVKIEALLDKISIEDPRGESMFTNMKAYIADSKHFRDADDYVRGFEAIVWAWAIFEIGMDLGIFALEQ